MTTRPLAFPHLKLVEPVGIEPTTSTMPLSRIRRFSEVFCQKPKGNRAKWRDFDPGASYNCDPEMTPEFPAMSDDLHTTIGRVGARKGWIYFIQSIQGGPIKIGWSFNPAVRIANLIPLNPWPLRFLALTPGYAQDEKAMHERFRHHRLHGEWFADAADLLDLIASLPKVDPEKTRPPAMDLSSVKPRPRLPVPSPVDMEKMRAAFATLE